MYGNGLIGARVEGKELKLKDYYEPSNWVWLAEARPRHAGHTRDLQIQGPRADDHRQQGMPRLPAGYPVGPAARITRRRSTHAAALQ